LPKTIIFFQEYRRQNDG